MYNTFPNPARSERSFPSKFICPAVQVNFSLIEAACCDLAEDRCRLAVDLERDRSSMLPPPWLVTAATTQVRMLLDSLSRSAAGSSFFRTSLLISRSADPFRRELFAEVYWYIGRGFRVLGMVGFFRCWSLRGTMRGKESLIFLMSGKFLLN